MIKFLLYLFLFYIISRLLFGKFMGGNSVKTKIYRFDTHHHHYKEEKQPDGKITINPNIPKSKSTNDRNLGEYVDYEEVK
ncbi:MAG: hypothetical protein IT246_10985 [Bacteroidia bacterium]|nr:hypothetical protein [Bacteroidia bacterium]MCZ2141302.1 DUF4834 family protein [Bacteroidia bacterium]